MRTHGSLPVFLLLLAIFHQQAGAATDTWSGAGADANWMTAGNWTGGTAPASGDRLVFPATAPQQTNVNNYPVDTPFAGLTIGNGYSVSGNRILVSGTITAGGIVLNCDLSLGANLVIVMTNASSQIDLNGQILTNGFAMTIDCAGEFFSQNTISGTGSLIITNANSAYLLTANTFSGGTVINGGILSLGTSGAIGTGAVAVNGTGALYLQAQRANPIILSNALTFASTASPALWSLSIGTYSASTIDEINGPVTLSQPTAIEVGIGSGPFSLTITSDMTGSGGFTKLGIYPLIVTGSSVLGGPVEISAGSIEMQSEARIDAPHITVDSGAALQLEDGCTTFATPLTLNGSGLSGFGALCALGGGSAPAAITLGSNTTIGSYSTDFSPNVLGLGAIGGSGVLTYVGDGIVGCGGANTYVGATVSQVSDLVLSTNYGVSMPGDLTVADGCTVDSSNMDGQFASGSHVTLGPGSFWNFDLDQETIASLTGSGEFEIGYIGRLSLQTSGTSTFSGDIVQEHLSPSGGIITIGGTGTWRTSGANTALAGFTVTGGTLEVDGDSQAMPVTLMGGILAGDGKVGDIHASGGMISPGGAQDGILSCGALQLASAVTVLMDVAGSVPGYSQDQIVTAGQVSLAGATIAFAAPPPEGGEVLIHNTSGVPLQGTAVCAEPLSYGANAGADLSLADVSVSLANGQNSPTAVPSVRFAITFSTAVVDFTPNAILLSGTALPTTVVISGISPDYIATVTGMSLPGTISASIPGGVVHDATGHANLASVNVGNVAVLSLPQTSVAITIASTQADPATSAPVLFTAIFSAPVTGFMDAAVTIGGSAAPTAAVVSGSGALYQISVSGMTGTGLITVAIPAGAARDVNGLLTLAGPTTAEVEFTPAAASATATSTTGTATSATATAGTATATTSGTTTAGAGAKSGSSCGLGASLGLLGALSTFGLRRRRLR